MTDKDLEAFEKWSDQERGKILPHEENHIISVSPRTLKLWERQAWQAACEYKDKEQYIEGSIHESAGIKREMTWRESSEMMENMYRGAIAQLDREYARIRKMQSENKKLREALELIAGEQEFFDEISDRSKTMMARKALKEVGEV